MKEDMAGHVTQMGKWEMSTCVRNLK